MSEQTIAQPLSGAEIADAVCDKVREMLRRDCHMNPAMAYEAFSGEIRIKLKLKDCGRILEVGGPVKVESETPLTEEAILAEADAAIYEQPPNAARRDAGLPLPTLVTDAEGKKTIKPVRYNRARTGEDSPI